MHPVLIYTGIYFVALIAFLVVLEAINGPADIKLIIGVPGIVSIFLGRWLVKKFPDKETTQED